MRLGLCWPRWPRCWAGTRGPSGPGLLSLLLLRLQGRAGALLSHRRLSTGLLGAASVWHHSGLGRLQKTAGRCRAIDGLGSAVSREPRAQSHVRDREEGQGSPGWHGQAGQGMEPAGTGDGGRGLPQARPWLRPGGRSWGAGCLCRKALEVGAKRGSRRTVGSTPGTPPAALTTQAECVRECVRSWVCGGECRGPSAFAPLRRARGWGWQK